MLKISILAGFLMIALVSLQWLQPSPAQCGFCFNSQCIDSGICGAGCFCLKEGSEGIGRCVSLSRAQESP